MNQEEMLQDEMYHEEMEQEKIITLKTGAEHAKERADKYLSEQFPEYSRSYLQSIMKDGLVTINGAPIKANYKLSGNEVLTIKFPEMTELTIEPEDMDIEILYEDKDVILVNKPKGVVVHPAAGHYSHTLVNFLLYHCRDELSGINGVLRPGIVHRIDMDTTGVLIACKNDISHRFLAEQLKEHSITRKYRAIVHGVLADVEGTINAPIGRHPTDRKKMSIHCKNGKEAITHYRVLKRFSNFSYIECQLETGRTHQIRVHMASIGHPLLGDNVYGPAKSKFKLEGQCLHAMVLGFIHPTTQEYMEFEAPLPEYFEKLLNIL